MVATTLGRVYPVVDYTIPPAGRGPRRYWNVLRTVWDVRRRVPRQQPGAVVMTQDAALIRPRTRAKRVVILHHVDDYPRLLSRVYAALRGRLFRVLAEADAVVVVSRFWRDCLTGRGLDNVHIIYNAYDTRRFDLG